MTCHQNAFEFFGSVPKRVMVDNLKSAVLRRILGRPPVFSPKYLDFANHYGFAITPCNVGKGNEKGRVENAVGYVKKNFLAGLDIPGFVAIAPAARHWLETVANVRIHGETRKSPVALFEKERPCYPRWPKPLRWGHRQPSQGLQPIPHHPGHQPLLGAGRVCRSASDVKKLPDRLCIYCGDKLLARHVRSYDRHQDFEDPDHPRQLLVERKKARDQKIFMRFLALSPQADLYYRKLAERRMNPHHHVRKIVALSEIYGPAPVARAIEDAFFFEAFSSEYIANLLGQRTRFHKEPSALDLTRREDLLDITLENPDLSVYQPERKKDD